MPGPRWLCLLLSLHALRCTAAQEQPFDRWELDHPLSLTVSAIMRGNGRLRAIAEMMSCMCSLSAMEHKTGLSPQVWSNPR